MQEKVMFAAECDLDSKGWRRVRKFDPAECSCIGTTQEGYEYKEVGGVLYGRPGVVERLRKSLEGVLPFAGVTPIGKLEREKLINAVRLALSVLEDLGCLD